jgi:hypothetical protein
VLTALPSAPVTLAPGASRLVAVIVDVRRCGDLSRTWMTWTVSAGGVTPVTTSAQLSRVPLVRH